MIDHALKVSHNLMIPESQDQVSLAQKNNVADFVVLPLLRQTMLTSVEFDYDFCAVLDEI